MERLARALARVDADDEGLGLGDHYGLEGGDRGCLELAAVGLLVGAGAVVVRRLAERISAESFI